MYRWKSRIVAIFLLFLTLSILKYGASKWPHRVIRGSKIKSTWILFKSMSDCRPWLKNSKNVIIFQMRHVVLTLGVVKGQRLVFILYRGQKIKLLRFSWKWWHIVRLPIGIQKKNSLHYLQCLLHMFLDQNVTGHHSANGNKPFLHHISVTWHFRWYKVFFFWILSSRWTICHHFQENWGNLVFFTPVQSGY